MNRTKRQEQAAQKLLAILESHVEGLPKKEQDAKWQGLRDDVSKMKTRATPEAPPRTLRNRASTRRTA
jgi:hypothetical protein